jgi:hypoxanthine phosphoribosyltransferase
MEKDVKEILIDEETLAEKIKELGEKITKDYEGKTPILVGLLKGAVPFMAAIMKEIKLPVNIDFMGVSSYGNKSTSSGVVRILHDLSLDIEGKEILIIEDIIDSGNTLSYLLNVLENKGAKDIKICTLLDKPSRREKDIKVDYVGFEIPDEFLVGFGLDYAEKYRNLPYIGILDPSAIEDGQ